jgi:hypothetical protein
MIVRISQKRFEKRYPSIPSPEISPRHWFENSRDKSLGLIVFYPPLESWGAAIFKKRQGCYKTWRQAAGLSTEKEALHTLLQLFGLTDRGYREALAEREFLTKPGGRMEFFLNSGWKFDPSYTAEIQDYLDAPVTRIVQQCFTEIYPELRNQLHSVPGHKRATTLQAFTTGCEAKGEAVIGLFCLVVNLDGPDEIRVFAGSESFIKAERDKFIQYWKELENRPGVNVHWHHTAVG